VLNPKEVEQGKPEEEKQGFSSRLGERYEVLSDTWLFKVVMCPLIFIVVFGGFLLLVAGLVLPLDKLGLADFNESMDSMFRR
jgi:hypothetical protein